MRPTSCLMSSFARSEARRRLPSRRPKLHHLQIAETQAQLARFLEACSVVRVRYSLLIHHNISFTPRKPASNPVQSSSSSGSSAGSSLSTPRFQSNIPVARAGGRMDGPAHRRDTQALRRISPDPCLPAYQTETRGTGAEAKEAPHTQRRASDFFMHRSRVSPESQRRGRGLECQPALLLSPTQRPFCASVARYGASCQQAAASAYPAAAGVGLQLAQKRVSSFARSALPARSPSLRSNCCCSTALRGRCAVLPQAPSTCAVALRCCKTQS